MNNKRKILELINEAEKNFSDTGKPVLDVEEFVAEYLAKKNVTILPCKPGDTVYAFCDTFGVVLPYIVETVIMGHYGYHFEAICSKDDELLDDIEFDDEDIGKDVFLIAEGAIEKSEKDLENNIKNAEDTLWGELFS